jgi:excisionase family DNA binding protein
MEFYTTKEAANILGYNDDSYVRRLIVSKKLRAKRSGNQWSVSEKDIFEYKINKEIKSKFRKLIEFNQSLRKIVDVVLDKEPKVVGPKDMLGVFAIGRGCKQHEAILMLCKEGFGEDAAILARSLFDLLITYLYILKDKSDQRAYRYFDYDWVLREKMFSNIKGKEEIMRLIENRQGSSLPFDSTVVEVTNIIVMGGLIGVCMTWRQILGGSMHIKQFIICSVN